MSRKEKKKLLKFLRSFKQFMSAISYLILGYGILFCLLRNRKRKMF